MDSSSYKIMHHLIHNFAGSTAWQNVLGNLSNIGSCYENPYLGVSCTECIGYDTLSGRTRVSFLFYVYNIIRIQNTIQIVLEIYSKLGGLTYFLLKWEKKQPQTKITC